MAKAQMETAAQRYARIREKRGVELFDVECKARGAEGDFPAIEGCGMVWKARREALDFWVTAGILPSNLASKIAGKTGGLTGANLLKSLKPDEIVQGIDFTNRLVLHTAVEPRIVASDVEGPNDVLQKDVMTCCYNTLLRWQMGGGDEGKTLDTFPR